jgi:hypothetical protein
MPVARTDAGGRMPVAGCRRPGAAGWGGVGLRVPDGPIRCPSLPWLSSGYLSRVRRLSQLRRDPHMLGWFRWLSKLRPPVGNYTREQRLLCLRRLLDDLAAQANCLQPGRIIREGFPVRQEYLPRPLSPEDDQRLQEELRRPDSLYSNALLLAGVISRRCRSGSEEPLRMGLEAHH